MKKILVVDDDAELPQRLKTVLEPYQFTVETASNGQEAIERVETTVPDGIFLDLRMPVMDGLEALDIRRRAYPDVTIIITTDSKTRDIVQQVRGRGADACLLKPFDPQELRAVLRDSFGWAP